MTLRDEIGVRPDPEFDLVLPPGWARHGLEDGSYDALLAQLKRRCFENHQPQVYAEMKAHLEQSFADMRKAGVIAYFTATDPGPDTLAIPASINASIKHAEPGTNLDDLVRSLIRDQGAEPLLGDKGTLRFETERNVRVGTDTIVNHSVVYMTPVPGSKRRRALVLVAGFARPLDVSVDSESMNAHRFLFDAVAASLTWRAPDSVGR